MTSKIFRSILLVAAAVLVASLGIIMGCLYDYFGSVQEYQMKDELNLAAVAVESEGEAFLEQLHSDRYRLTWVDANGDVRYDTQAGGKTLENHASRPEIKSAMETGEGENVRYSSTLLEKTLYYAQRLADGTVLRISVSADTIGVLALGMLRPILIVLAVALILSGTLARRLSRRIVEPLNVLDLENPLDNDAYEELSPLLNRINRQHLEITRQMRALRQMTNEFAQITRSMREALVLLDEKGCVLSVNLAAEKLLQTDGSCVGRDFLTVERSHEVSAAIARAMADGHGEVRCERGGRTYQFDITRIDSDGAAVGAVLLAFDITEQEYAERNRREFSANVSHELKTPLQGIIGSAELIEKGMVAPEDVPRFVGHIRMEAARLMTLIGDIIRLTQLDEGVEMPRERVDLRELADEVTDSLRGEAAKRNIVLSVEGEKTEMEGVPRLLYEIIYNLCDNAIKYNVEDGRVDISVAQSAANATVTVRDTGIGIPAEDQPRIFERFYRVDKSHSKASGGTGLGLSIVKHAVQYHHGTIELHSEPGKGTEIIVSFPL